MKILLTDSPYWNELGEEFQVSYEDKLKQSYEKCFKLLPFGAPHLSILAQPRTYDNMEEFGDWGYTPNGELVMLSFDPNLPFGKDGVIKRLKPILFHEMNHAARYNLGIWHSNFVDSCILEGLAVVFERDFANSDPIYGHYENDPIEDWFKEVMDLSDESKQDDYMYQHPDGRKWVGYKVGTWIVDEAMRKSGKSVIDLTQMECRDILKLADLN